jgi:phosphonoacetaldehyde hydrolase
MVFRNLEALRVFPPAAVVKVGDTDVDIDEARNAGCWAIGVTRTGNALARTAAEVREMDPSERARLIVACGERLRERGAHAVIESVADLLPCLDDIERRLARGERP